jgi:hypothetical protein
MPAEYLLDCEVPIVHWLQVDFAYTRREAEVLVRAHPGVVSIGVIFCDCPRLTAHKMVKKAHQEYLQ